MSGLGIGGLRCNRVTQGRGLYMHGKVGRCDDIYSENRISLRDDKPVQ